MIVCVQLGKKFGVAARDAIDLLGAAHNMNLNVIGACFHVGSGLFDASAFSDAVEITRGVFNDARRVGYQFNLLDVGGGFPGCDRGPIYFQDVARVLQQAIDQYFPLSEGVCVIGEPGRYFVESCGTLAVNIITKKQHKRAAAGHPVSRMQAS